MCGFRLTAPLWLGLYLLALGGCSTPSTVTASQAQVPPMEPGAARVWFWRQSDPPGGNVDAAEPMVFANGAPIAQSKEGTAFFHSFRPGTYRFTVQAYGTPTGERDKVQLIPGAETYLQIEPVQNWESGSSVGGWSFILQPTSAEVAKQYLPTLTYLGQR
jgi:hypothetical protein